MVGRFSTSSFFMFCSCAAFAMPQAAGAQDAVPQKERVSYSYRIGPQDLLEIRVFEEPELNVNLRVGEGGEIQLPLLGEFPVEGLGVSEVSRRLKLALEKTYLQRATVTVEVKEIHSRPIAVIGAVHSPGNLTVGGRISLLEALTQAGGLTANRGSVISVLRTADNGLSDQIEISIEELYSGRSLETNIPILPNDLISVSEKSRLVVYLLGEVNIPGDQVFEARERVTLLMALSRAGGLTDRASNKITIRRGEEPELKVSYKQVLSGRQKDPLLADQDVIWVRESFF